MTKKILLSLAMIALVIASVTSATVAYFSDTATSAGNTFSAGTMEFRIARPGETNHRIFDISNLKPGQVVKGYLVVVNDSTAELDMKWKAWIPSFSDGVLDDVLEVRITMKPSEYTEYNAFTSAGYTLAGHEFVTQGWTSIHNLGVGNNILAWNYPCKEEGAGDPQPFRVDWAGVYKIEVRMQESAGNNYQGTSFTGDLNFYATQCENNL